MLSTDRPPETLRQDLVTLLPRLRRYGHAVTGNAADAEDLVQAACEKALRARSTPDGDARVDLWMFRIMRNHWLDHVRSAGHRSRADMDDTSEPGDDGKGARLAEDRLMLAQVRAAMANLAPDHREVLALVALDGLSYKEAAETLGLPQGTIMSRLARARKALAARLN